MTLGELYVQQEKYTSATDTMTELLKIKPTYTDAYVFRGLVYLKQDAIKEAFRDITKALKLSPDNAQAYKIRGIYYLKNRKRAAESFQKAHELDPEAEDIIRFLNEMRE